MSKAYIRQEQKFKKKILNLNCFFFKRGIKNHYPQVQGCSKKICCGAGAGAGAGGMYSLNVCYLNGNMNLDVFVFNE